MENGIEITGLGEVVGAPMEQVPRHWMTAGRMEVGEQRLLELRVHRTARSEVMAGAEKDVPR
ncbi:hypothetical protein GCM10008959_41680 [Deinococcus seoulensis]|uniref:Uncharacterized protein n=1 Tax=Deinococcus seoulensis TaxID=1837379 RepID=A0ABQ2S0S0_9DEIO|nr:hypothetical protein GCM10008959_41680 [Deinococcus seoulensis]